MPVPSLDSAIRLHQKSRQGADAAAADAEALRAVSARVRTRFRNFNTDAAQLTPAERIIFRVFIELDSEVANGGLDQYVRNSSGDRAQDALHDLKAIAATGSWRVLNEMSEWFPGKEIPSDLDSRFDQLIEMEDADEAGFETRMDTLTDRFRAALPEMYSKLMDYVEAHRAELEEPRT